MRFIVNILRRLFQLEQKKILGRWNIDYNTKIVNNKIDLSNEDHCGPCGQYIINSQKNKFLQK